MDGIRVGDIYECNLVVALNTKCYIDEFEGEHFYNARCLDFTATSKNSMNEACFKLRDAIIDSGIAMDYGREGDIATVKTPEDQCWVTKENPLHTEEDDFNHFLSYSGFNDEDPDTLRKMYLAFQANR